MLQMIGISLVIGLIIGFLVAGSHKKALKTVEMQAKADNYVRIGSLNLRVRNESFLYRNVTKIPRQTQQNKR